MSAVGTTFTNGPPSLTAGALNAAFALCQAYSAILDTVIAQGGAPSFVAPAAWTPTDASGGSLTFTSVSAEYAVVGNILLLSAQLTYPSTADTHAAAIGGIPYTLPNKGYANAPDLLFVNGGAACSIVGIQNTSSADVYSITTGGTVTNATLSGKTVSFQLAAPLS